MTVSELERIIARAQSADIVVSVDGKDSMLREGPTVRELIADWRLMHKTLNDGFNEDGVHPIEARDILRQLKLKP